MLSLLLTASLVYADPVVPRELPPIIGIKLDGPPAPATETDPTEDLRHAVRQEDLEALHAALAAGGDPWNSSSGPTPVWMALDRPRAFLEAMMADVPPEQHAALIRMWSRLDPEDPRRAILDRQLPEALQATDPERVRDWLSSFSHAEQDDLLGVIGLELLPRATTFSPEQFRRARGLFGDHWLPRIVWEGAEHYDYDALPDGPPLDEAHVAALRAGWQEIGFLAFMEAELQRQDFHPDGELVNLVCGVSHTSAEDHVRGAFGRPASGTIRRTEAHLFWPEVEVYLQRAGGEMRVSRIYMTGDPQGCWSKGARLIGASAPFARWVLGPEPWTTSDGAQLTLFAGEDGHVGALELVWPQEVAP